MHTQSSVQLLTVEGEVDGRVGRDMRTRRLDPLVAQST